MKKIVEKLRKNIKNYKNAAAMQLLKFLLQTLKYLFNLAIYACAAEISIVQ